MGYTYTPAYYSTFQDSIASICKSILPFSLKNRRLTAAEQKLSKLQSDNLKWQQNCFHQILNMMGLHKEGMLPSSQLDAFRSHLLDTLIASNAAAYEHPSVLRDKLLFLQELLYAKCISEEEYHASKKPLLQRLAVQGSELEATDVIVGPHQKESPDHEEEWSVIDLRDEHSQLKKENSSSKNKFKNGTSTALKHIKDTASVLQKIGKSKQHKSIFDQPVIDQIYPNEDAAVSGDVTAQTGVNPFGENRKNCDETEAKSVLMSEGMTGSSANDGGGFQGIDKGKRRPFQSLFRKEAKDGVGEGVKLKDKHQRSAKKQWGFGGLKQWKWTDKEDETTPLPLGDKSSDCENYVESSKLVRSPGVEGPDATQIKKKLFPDSLSSGFIIDKVLGDKIKKELTRIQSELSCTNPDFLILDDQMNRICTKLPVDKSDLKQFLPKSWCDKYGDVVIDVVKKQLEDHVGENESIRNATMERRQTNSKRWTTFEDDENCNPNLSAAQDNMNSTFYPDQNPFWNVSLSQGK